MIWHWLSEFAWQDVVFNADFLYLTCWFASGYLIGWLPGQWRLRAFLLVAILLQGILRGWSLPAFELMSILAYLYALTVQRTLNRKTPIEQANSPAARSTYGDPEAVRWALCCWGIALLIFVAFAARDFFTLQQSSIEIGNVRWLLLYLDFIQLLRLITFFHEYGSGQEELPAVDHYLLWINLPIPGLIIRLSEFLPQLERISVTPTWADVFNVSQLRLLGLGLAKWSAGVGLASVTISSFAAELAWVYKWGAVFCFGPWSFYLMGAGSVDVQHFVARTWNLSLPVAWNAPFFRTNLSTFWANWNMTMMAIYRDYLFFNRWGLTQPNLYFNAMIVFVAMGLWHALNLYWFLFGVYHGIGFCAYLWFQQFKKKHPLGKWASSWPVLFVCWLMTYVFVCLGWLIPSKIVVYLGSVGETSYE